MLGAAIGRLRIYARAEESVRNFKAAQGSGDQRRSRTLGQSWPVWCTS